MIEEKYIDMIGDTLKLLTDRIYEETGEKMLIGYGITDGDITIEGCCTTNGLNYGMACKLLCGIQWCAIDWYGNLPEEEAKKLDK